MAAERAAALSKAARAFARAARADPSFSRALVDLGTTALRQRIAAQHRPASPWDVKHRRGGLVDIEFVAQYLQLRHAAAEQADFAGLLHELWQQAFLVLLEFVRQRQNFLLHELFGGLIARIVLGLAAPPRAL